MDIVDFKTTQIIYKAKNNLLNSLENSVPNLKTFPGIS